MPTYLVNLQMKTEGGVKMLMGSLDAPDMEDAAVKADVEFGLFPRPHVTLIELPPEVDWPDGMKGFLLSDEDATSMNAILQKLILAMNKDGPFGPPHKPT